MAVTSRRRAVAAVPVPAGTWRVGALVERNWLAFRNAWTALVSGFFEPVFHLFALGVGLGALVGDVVTDSGDTVTYPVSWRPRCWPRRR